MTLTRIKHRRTGHQSVDSESRPPRQTHQSQTENPTRVPAAARAEPGSPITMPSANVVAIPPGRSTCGKFEMVMEPWRGAGVMIQRMLAAAA